MKFGSTPIPFWQSDPDYYSPKDPKYKEHLKRITENLHIDKLLAMCSSDGSYSVTVPSKRNTNS